MFVNIGFFDMFPAEPVAVDMRFVLHYVTETRPRLVMLRIVGSEFFSAEFLALLTSSVWNIFVHYESPVGQSTVVFFFLQTVDICVFRVCRIVKFGSDSVAWYQKVFTSPVKVRIYLLLSLLSRGDASFTKLFEISTTIGH